MANGMFRTGGDNTSTTGGVTVTVEPGVGLPGDVDYGTIPSDLIRDEIAETAFIRDFLTKFKDKLEGKDASEYSEWIRVLGDYATGNAELSDLESKYQSELDRNTYPPGTGQGSGRVQDLTEFDLAT